MMLTLQLADKGGLCWAQEQVLHHHYLHRPVDARCSPVTYLVRFNQDPVGCLIFGRTESTRCLGWYGSIQDVEDGVCRLTRWQILNLARVWLHPSIQQGGEHYIPNAATMVIAQALRMIVRDYLVLRPPVWIEEPYEIREVLSYCDRSIHTGALYRAANFKLVRTNDRGIETYARTVRRLTHAEHALIGQCSAEDKRARRLRREREYRQLPLPLCE